MPFGHIQLKNMLALSEAGAIVSCASPGFYHRPQSVQDQIDFVVGRVLDQFGFDNQLFKRWKSENQETILSSDLSSGLGSGSGSHSDLGSGAATHAGAKKNK
jgi:hypothetical protein